MTDKNETKQPISGITAGDITGAGIIVGNNIHIEGDVIVQTSKEALSLGLTLLAPKYFQTRGVEGDFENWKSGFGFELPDIMAGLEFKREDLISDIIKKLDGKPNIVSGHTVLLLGKSGSSKSTILMELICHYFKEQYIVLYNYGEEKIENVSGIIRFIEDKLEQGKIEAKENKILVAVDNVHNERTAAIFAVIDEFHNHIKKDNLRFILCARQPEFDRFVEDRLGRLPSEIRRSIEKLVNTDGIKFEVKPFDETEIENFIRRYEDDAGLFVRNMGFEINDLNDDKKLNELASQIYEETRGDPILVKFFLLGKGLLHDVEDRYKVHLSPSEDKLRTALVCSILNITGIPVTSTLTDCMNLTTFAEELTGQTITFSDDTQSWKSIHPAWDLALLIFVFTSSKDIAIVNKRKRSLRKGMEILFSCLTSEDDKYSVLGMMYDCTTIETEEKKILPINIIEEVITRPNTIADELSNRKKSELYSYNVGRSFYELERLDDSIKYCDYAIELDPNNKVAWNGKGLVLGKQSNFDQAVKCFDKAIELDPEFEDAWNNKGTAFANLGRSDMAIHCFDKAIELDPTDKGAWYNKGVALADKGDYEQVIHCYDKAIELDPEFEDAWYSKGLTLAKHEDYDKAIACFDKVIELDPSDKDALYNKGNALWIKGEYDQAIVCYDKVIELDPEYKDVWNDKALALADHDDYDQAILSIDKAIELDPSDNIAWDNKGWIHYKYVNIDKAVEAVDEAIKMDPKYANAYYHKSIYMIKKGNIDEALSCLNKAIEIDRNYIEDAKTDTDFDPIRKDTRFIKIISSSE